MAESQSVHSTAQTNVPKRGTFIGKRHKTITESLLEAGTLLSVKVRKTIAEPLMERVRATSGGQEEERVELE